MTTATDTPTLAPPAPAVERNYSEQLHTLVDLPTREYVLGLALVTAAQEGKAPREGRAVRTLLDAAIALAYEADPKAYERAVRAGRRALRDRARQRNKA